MAGGPAPIFPSQSSSKGEESAGSAGAAGSNAGDGTAGSAGSAGTSGAAANCNRNAYAGDFTAHSSAELATLQGYTVVTGNLAIGSEATNSPTDIADLSVLGCLQVVEQELLIVQNPALRDLTGLGQLLQVSKLTITSNTGLQSLQGLNSLSVLQNIEIRENAALTSLTRGIISASQLVVQDNTALPQCWADQLSEQLGITCQCQGNLDGGHCN